MAAFAASALAALLAFALSFDVSQGEDTPIEARDRGLLAAQAERLQPQRPGIVDLYAIGVAGDGEEDVFRNEVGYFGTLLPRRLGARGVVSLVNHPDSLVGEERPLATWRNLRAALARTAARMDVEEDVLLLYLTMHGTDAHELVLNFPPFVDDALTPADLGALLDYAGIRNAVVVVSACYAGGFVPALRGPDTLVIAAARADRTSFGCGAASNVTWFGRAWLVEGLNDTDGFIAAFDHAKRRVRTWEREEKLRRSMPQIAVGARIAGRLQRMQAQNPPGPRVAYPYPLDD